MRHLRVATAVAVVASFVSAAPVVVPIGGQTLPAVARPTYLILVDVDSLGEADARQACIVIGAFVDRLDPDDRVAVLALSKGPVSGEATTDRLAARNSLEAIIARAVAAREAAVKGNVTSLAAAIGIVLADSPPNSQPRFRPPSTWQEQPTDPGARTPAPSSDTLRKQALEQVQAAGCRLFPVTTQLLVPPSMTARRLVVWVTNYPDNDVADASGEAARLINAASLARTSISILIPAGGRGPLSAARYHAGYERLASATGGIPVQGIGDIDAVARALLAATAGSETRRVDPAGISELTSLRRCAERVWNRSAYATLVTEYRVGNPEDALKALGAWIPAQVLSEVVPPASLADVQAAIALHTEVGVQGGPVGQVHLGIARRAVEAVWSRQPENEVCRRWVLTMSAYSHEIVRGVQIGGAETDPAVLVALGSALEVPTSLETPPGLDRVQPPASDLTQAMQLYRRALARDPTFTEARVRFGRVLGLLGQRQGAIVELERARAESRDARLSYLASLFLGDVLETAGDGRAAVAAYRTAIQTCPYGLAARVALARLLKSSGQQVEIRQVLPEGLNLQGVPAANGRGQSGAARDPWQDYVHGSPGDVARELAALREAARK